MSSYIDDYNNSFYIDDDTYDWNKYYKEEYDVFQLVPNALDVSYRLKIDDICDLCDNHLCFIYMIKNSLYQLSNNFDNDSVELGNYELCRKIMSDRGLL